MAKINDLYFLIIFAQYIKNNWKKKKNNKFSSRKLLNKTTSKIKCKHIHTLTQSKKEKKITLFY